MNRLFKNINTELARAVVSAALECGNSEEEQGGVVVTSFTPQTGEKEFRFIKVLNDKAGTPIATGLYVANPDDFGSKVFPLLTRGWYLYASFHTHPTFSANPSSLDREKLFKGFKYNFIYSTLEKTVSCSEWSPQTDLHTIYLNITTLTYLANE